MWRVRDGDTHRGVQRRMKKEELGTENIGHSFNKFLVKGYRGIGSILKRKNQEKSRNQMKVI